MSNTFNQYRDDGWPLCPQCEGDELYSVYLMTAHAIDRQVAGETIFVEEVLNYPFRCYNCNWGNIIVQPQLTAAMLETINASPSDARG